MNNFKYKNILFMLFIFSLVCFGILQFQLKSNKPSIAEESEEKYIFTSIEKAESLKIDDKTYDVYDIHTNCNSLVPSTVDKAQSLGAQINYANSDANYYIKNQNTICVIFFTPLENEDKFSLINKNFYGCSFENAEFIFNDNNFSKKSDIKVTIVINENSIEQSVLDSTYTFNSINDYPIYCYKYNNQLYKFGDTINIDNNITVEAVLLDFAMEKGASVRLSNNSSGMRFTSSISKESEKQLTDVYQNVSYGTIILPTDKIKNDFILDNFNEKEILDIPANNLIETAVNLQFTGVITNIYTHNFLRNFSSRGYIKIDLQGKEYYIYTPYSKDDNSRSVFEISKKAKADTDYFNTCEETEKTIINSFINKIIELNIDYDKKIVTVPEEKVTYYKFCDGNLEITLENISVNIEKLNNSIQFDLNHILVNGKITEITIMSAENVITLIWPIKD